MTYNTIHILKFDKLWHIHLCDVYTYVAITTSIIQYTSIPKLLCTPPSSAPFPCHCLDNYWSAFCPYTLVCISKKFCISGIIPYVLSFFWLLSLSIIIWNSSLLFVLSLYYSFSVFFFFFNFQPLEWFVYVYCRV